MKALNLKLAALIVFVGFSAGFFVSCGGNGATSSLPSRVSTDAVSTSSS